MDEKDFFYGTKPESPKGNNSRILNDLYNNDPRPDELDSYLAAKREHKSEVKQSSRASHYEERNRDRILEKENRNEKNRDEHRERYERDRSRTHEDHRVKRSSRPPKTVYNIHKLKNFLAKKSIYITKIFITEDTITFLSVMIESVGEEILVYIPSKYSIDPPEENILPVYELDPFEIEETSSLLAQETDVYNEIHSTDLYDDDNNELLVDDYKPIEINKKSNNQLYRYYNQLQKFKNCVSHIRYKIGIITDRSITIINRHNEIDTYKVLQKRIGGYASKPNMILIIDLENFYKKLDRVGDDIINVHKTFYGVLHKAHNKQSLILEARMKNYHVTALQLTALYTQKSKFLDMMDTLTNSLEQAKKKEYAITVVWNEIESKREQSKTLNSEVDRSFKLSKTEKELQSVKDLKNKIIKTLRDIKHQYNQFLLDYDYSVGESVKRLNEITRLLQDVGVDVNRVK